MKKEKERVDIGDNLVYIKNNDTGAPCPGKELTMTRFICKNSMISSQEHYWFDSESSFVMPIFAGVEVVSTPRIIG